MTADDEVAELSDPDGQDAAGQDTVGEDSDSQDTAGQDTAGQDSDGQDTAGQDTVGQDSASEGSGSGPGGPEQIGQVDVPRCPACDAPVAASANWCEACGHDLAVSSAPADSGNRPVNGPDETVGHAGPSTGLSTPGSDGLSGGTPDDGALDDRARDDAHDAVTASTVPCQACGETEIDADGYCLSCGYRQPSERNHVSEIAGPVAAATDRGGIRHRNEDAFAIAMADGGHAVMVVCDGVSSTPGSEEASTSAAQAACHRLVAGLKDAAGATPDGDNTGSRTGDDTGNKTGSNTGNKTGDDTDDGTAGAANGSADPTAHRVVGADPSSIASLLVAAVADAQQAATSAAETIKQAEEQTAGQALGPLSDPPSTTLVCAVASVDHTGSEPMLDLHVAWVGDSRCYWVTADSEQLLTTDHEEFGALSRWLGADSTHPEPDLVHHRIPMTDGAANGWIVVCSDGLWRYLTPASGIPAHELMAALTHNLGRGAKADSGPAVDGSDRAEAVLAAGLKAQGIVEGLLEFANNRGGHDNITAAVTSATDLAQFVGFRSAT